MIRANWTRTVCRKKEFFVDRRSKLGHSFEETSSFSAQLILASKTEFCRSCFLTRVTVWTYYWKIHTDNSRNLDETNEHWSLRLAYIKEWSFPIDASQEIVTSWCIEMTTGSKSTLYLGLKVWSPTRYPGNNNENNNKYRVWLNSEFAASSVFWSYSLPLYPTSKQTSTRWAFSFDFSNHWSKISRCCYISISKIQYLTVQRDICLKTSISLSLNMAFSIPPPRKGAQKVSNMLYLPVASTVPPASVKMFNLSFPRHTHSLLYSKSCNYNFKKLQREGPSQGDGDISHDSGNLIWSRFPSPADNLNTSIDNTNTEIFVFMQPANREK